ncbi:NAD(P)-binding protein [Serendipita vermifera]|nr:NAD(P)-binding protein [Serendipita vermifera]
MPSVTTPATVLVTGCSGFIAVWIVRSLLEKGYNVVGTVRKPAKGDFVKELHKNLLVEGGPTLSYAIVKDVSIKDAFNDVVKEVNPDAIVHAASPVAVVDETVDPEELIRPAVNGTLGILESVAKFGSNVKRVVMLSSGAAITQLYEQPHVYTESDWNETSVNEIKSLGKKAGSIHKIRASATLAERAGWDWVAKNKDANFDFVAILPPFVFGPIIQEVDPNNLNFSSAMFVDPLKRPYSGTELLGVSINYADVRDIALMISLAVGKDGIGGERIVAAAGVMYWQDLYDILNALPEPIEGLTVPKGEPDEERKPHMQIYSHAKADALFNIRWRSLQEMAVDTINSARKIGAL